MLFVEQLWKQPNLYFSWVILVAFSICVHEFCHAYVALRQGDDTACRAGFMTLNPLHVMGPTSLIMLTLFGIAWGAVPVQHQRLRHRWSRAAVAAAGPFANLALGMVFALCHVLIARFLPDTGLSRMFLYTCFVGTLSNAFLFMLNMMPIPMMDGWDVMALFFPSMDRMDRQTRQRITLGAFLLLIFWGFGKLQVLAAWLAGFQVFVWSRLLGSGGA